MRLAVKRVWRVFVFLGCLAVILGASVAYAQDGEVESAPADEAKDESPVAAAETEAGKQLWFVELESPPSAEGTSATTLDREKEDFLEEAQSADVEIEERYVFDKLFNGLSLEIDESDVDVLGQLGTVKAVYPVQEVSSAQSSEEEEKPEAEPSMANAAKMTGADIARNQLDDNGDQLDGKGIKIGVIDSGIDYHHPDLGAGFGPDKRVVSGHDFVGDAFTGSGSKLVPDTNPDDCMGHGTHVAGIIGANGEVKGVAPGVTFGAYRVFGCSGGTTDDVIVAAMEQAAEDKVKLLNMSLGTSFQAWPQSPTAQASDRLVKEERIPVVAAAGNDGANGLYATEAPGVADEAIGVASYNNTHVTQRQFTISPDNRAIGYSLATGAPAAPISGSMQMARTGTKTATSDACSTLSATVAARVNGKATLIRRGGCDFYVKALNAQKAGATAIVLYNNTTTTGSFTATVEPPSGADKITIPVVTISGSEGNQINDSFGPVALTMTWTTGASPNPTGGLIASSSSYGMTADLKLKPDIGAPGGSVWSTYPLEKNAYTSLGGTSMATPHVAGAVALLLQARPDTSSQAVRDILQNSADPRPKSNQDPDLDNVHRQGAGMLDIDDAIQSTTRIQPGKLSLGESEAGPQTRSLTVENDGSSEVTYDLSHAPASATDGNTFAPTSYPGSASVTFGSGSVTVPAGGEATVDVTVSADDPALTDESLYGGYVVLTPRDGGKTYRVPYAGFKGDYQSIQALTPTTRGFPWLTKLNDADGLYYKQTGGALYTLYTLENGDVPYFLVHFDHQVRRMQMEVKNVNTGETWPRALDLEYLARHPTSSSGAFPYPWDGKAKDGNNEAIEVPDGKYEATLSVQKALGDDDNPAHWESWTSPSFTIDRSEPDAPAITSPGNDSYDNDGYVTLSGTAGADSTVEVLDGETSQGTTTAEPSGAWSKTLPEDTSDGKRVSDGEHSYTARVNSPVRGNSDASDAVKVTVDTSAPSAPRASFLDSSGKPVSPAYTDGNGVKWFKDAVTVHYSDSSDGSSGSGIESYTADQTFTDSGSHDYSGTATDYAGNESSATTGKVGIDKAGPTPDYELSSSPNDAGWNNKDVAVTLKASDEGGSGIKRITYSASGAQSIDSTTYKAPFTINEEDTTDITYEVEDNVGNVATTDPITVKLDKTKPEITDKGVKAGTAGKNNWYKSDVTNEFSVSDGLSGFSGKADPYTFPVTSSGEGSAVLVSSGSVSDRAGNVADPISVTFKVDKTAPDPDKLTFRGIQNGTTYPVNDLPEETAISCSATDETSGFDTCSFSGYSNAFGSHTLSATAYDKAGWSSTSTLTYIVGLKSGEVLSPINSTGKASSSSANLDSFKIKSTIPVKFKLYLDEAKTQLMTSPPSGSVARLTFFKQDSTIDTTDTSAELLTAGSANTDNNFRWSGSPDYQHIYNLGTSGVKSAGTYGVQLTLYASDGTTKLAQSDKYYFVLRS